LRPIDKVAGSTIHSLHLKFGATYTFLNQYAATTPEGVRHDQPSGRLDFTGAWSVYDHETTAGSINLLIRSGTNIGISQQFNLSDRLGSGLYLNCLQGGGGDCDVSRSNRSSVLQTDITAEVERLLNEKGSSTHVTPIQVAKSQ
jgi:hypothetical protein